MNKQVDQVDFNVSARRPCIHVHVRSAFTDITSVRTCLQTHHIVVVANLI